MRIGIQGRAGIVIVIITLIDVFNRLFGYKINFRKKYDSSGGRSQMRTLLETGHVVPTYFCISGSGFHERVLSVYVLLLRDIYTNLLN